MVFKHVGPYEPILVTHCAQYPPPCPRGTKWSASWSEVESWALELNNFKGEPLLFFLPEVNNAEVSTRVENYEAPPVHMNACNTKKTGEAQWAHAFSEPQKSQHGSKRTQALPSLDPKAKQKEGTPPLISVKISTGSAQSLVLGQ